MHRAGCLTISVAIALLPLPSRASPWAVVAQEPDFTAPFERVEPDPQLDRASRYRPRWQGTGMLAAGPIVGAGALAAQIAFTVVAAERTHAADPECFPSCSARHTLVTGGLVYNPLWAVALGLLGGGMALRGRWRAHADRYDLDAPKRRFPVRPGLGWGLFGGGMAVWATTRVVGMFADTDDATFDWWAIGYAASLGLTIPGLMLGAYGSGYRAMQRKLPPVSAGPLAGTHVRGIALTGRF